MSELFEICRDKKDASPSKITNQDLAEAIGKSTNTVAQFLRGDAPNASFDTVIGLCRELGVSIDDYAGIDTDNENQAKNDIHETIEKFAEEIHKEKAENAALKTGIEKMAAHMETCKRSLRMHRIVTLVLLALLSLALIALLLDVLNPNVGWVRAALGIGMLHL